MSNIKEYMFDVHEQKREAWIRERLRNPEADENTEGWAQLAEDYDSLQISLLEDAELSWHKERPSTEAHATFIEEMAGLRKILRPLPAGTANNQIYKMIYAHAVTLMEAFLSDSIKSLVLTNEIAFINTISNVEELSKSRFSLKEIHQQKNGAKGLAAKELSNVLYHNIPKVKKLYELALSKKINADIGALTTITHIRHDIVHRNGKTIDGEPIVLDKDVVLKAIEEIEAFASHIQRSIDLFIFENE